MFADGELADTAAAEDDAEKHFSKGALHNIFSQARIVRVHIISLLKGAGSPLVTRGLTIDKYAHKTGRLSFASTSCGGEEGFCNQRRLKSPPLQLPMFW